MQNFVDHPKMKRVALLLGLIMVVGVFIVCLMPLQIKTVENGDKIQHFLAYGGLMLWFGFWFPSRLRLWLVLFIAMGILIEFLQGLTPYRSFSVADMLANSIGALLLYAVLVWRQAKR